MDKVRLAKIVVQYNMNSNEIKKKKSFSTEVILYENGTFEGIANEETENPNDNKKLIFGYFNEESILISKMSIRGTEPEIFIEKFSSKPLKGQWKQCSYAGKKEAGSCKISLQIEEDFDDHCFINDSRVIKVEENIKTYKNKLYGFNKKHLKELKENLRDVETYYNMNEFTGKTGDD